MSHECRIDGDRHVKLDACCQYGVDVDIAERNGILEHKDSIQALLRKDAAQAPWFDEHETADPDFPSGRYVRTRTHGQGCIFLAHEGRGCAIHRAAIEGGWNMHGVKPHVCRLFPLSYESDAIVISDDYEDYSCGRAAHAPTLYQVARATLAEVFGQALIAALDQAEAGVLAMQRTLHVMAR